MRTQTAASRMLWFASSRPSFAMAIDSSCMSAPLADGGVEVAIVSRERAGAPFLPAPFVVLLLEQAIARRLWAGTQRLHRAFHSGAVLPGSGRAFSDVSTHKAHCTADLPMHLGGVVWAHQKGAGLSAAGARLHSLN